MDAAWDPMLVEPDVLALPGAPRDVAVVESSRAPNLAADGQTLDCWPFEAHDAPQASFEQSLLAAHVITAEDATLATTGPTLDSMSGRSTASGPTPDPVSERRTMPNDTELASTAVAPQPLAVVVAASNVAGEG